VSRAYLNRVIVAECAIEPAHKRCRGCVRDVTAAGEARKAMYSAGSGADWGAPLYSVSAHQSLFTLVNATPQVEGMSAAIGSTEFRAGAVNAS
jgi:hypothetical protein